MKQQKILTAILAFLSLANIATPYLASANHTPIKSNVFDPSTIAGPLLVCSGDTSNFNPCTDLCDFVAQFAQIIYFMIALVIWIIAPILVAVGGIMYMLAGANPGMLERAKKTLTGVVWGLAIVLCAWLIVYTFVSVLGSLGTYVGGFGTNGNAACNL
jgi:hypothetical protein